MQLTNCLNSVQLGIKEYSKLNLDFLLKKLSCTSEDIFILDEEEHEIPPFAAKFCSVQGQKHILAVASEDGDVLLLDTNRKAKTSLIKQWKAHYNAIFDICWLNGECKLITSSGDRTSVLWDVVSGEKIAIFKGHKSSIKNIRSRPNSQCVFATASRDGSIRIWDTRRNKSYSDISYGAEMTICDAHNAAAVIPGTPKQRKKKEMYSTSGNPLNSVTSIEFQNEHLLFSAGTADGVVKVWDLRRNYSTAKKAVPCVKFPYNGNSTKAHGFTSLVFNDSSSVLYANCTDSVIYAYNSSSYSPVPIATYHGHKTSTFFVKIAISNDNEYLLSGSSDNHAYIWKISQPGHPLLRLTGHQAEVTAVAWSSNDITKIVTCSDDVQVIFWDIKENLSGMPGEYDNKPIGKSEVISDVHLSRETATKVSERCFNDIDQDIQSTAICVSSPQTPNFINSPASRTSSPDITRWFKPSPMSATSYPINTTKPTSSIKHNSSCVKRGTSHGKKRTLLHLADKTPKRTLLDKMPNEERENHRLVTPKVVTSPDERRVLSPKKPISDTNFRNLQTVRRSLDMDSAMTHNRSSGNNSEGSSCKDHCDRKRECMTERSNIRKDKELRSKIRKTNRRRSEDKSSRLCINKISACSGQMALITSYFISAVEDPESTTGTQRDIMP